MAGRRRHPRRPGHEYGHPRNQADWLASEGYVAVAPSLLLGPADQVLDRDGSPSRAIAQRARRRAHWLAEGERCTGKIGVIGFCMGGDFALAMAPRRHGFSASSVNYGGATQEVEPALPDVCPIVGSFGAEDRWPGLSAVPDRLESMFAAACVEHDIKVYPGAGHGFLNDHEPAQLSLWVKAIAKLVRAGYHEPSTPDARPPGADLPWPQERHMADGWSDPPCAVGASPTMGRLVFASLTARTCAGSARCGCAAGQGWVSFPATKAGGGERPAEALDGRATQTRRVRGPDLSVRTPLVTSVVTFASCGCWCWGCYWFDAG